MIAYVGADIEKALMEVRKQLQASGIPRELKIRGYPKRSVRRRYKEMLSQKRRAGQEAKRRMAD